MAFSRGGGIRTPGAFQLNGFQDRRIRPLCHSSLIYPVNNQLFQQLQDVLRTEHLSSTVFPPGHPRAKTAAPETYRDDRSATPLYVFNEPHQSGYLSKSEFGGANLYLSLIPANAGAERYCVEIYYGRLCSIRTCRKHPPLNFAISHTLC